MKLAEFMQFLNKTCCCIIYVKHPMYCIQYIFCDFTLQHTNQVNECAKLKIWLFSAQWGVYVVVPKQALCCTSFHTVMKSRQMLAFHPGEQTIRKLHEVQRCVLCFVCFFFLTNFGLIIVFVYVFFYLHWVVLARSYCADIFLTTRGQCGIAVGLSADGVVSATVKNLQCSPLLPSVLYRFRQINPSLHIYLNSPSQESQLREWG